MPKVKDNLLSLLTNLWSHFRRRRKMQFSALVILSIITAFAEIFSLGAVLPFLAALTDPDALFETSLIQPVLRLFSITTPQEMLLPLTLVFIGAALGYFTSTTLLRLHNNKKGQHFTIYPRADSRGGGIVLSKKF